MKAEEDTSRLDFPATDFLRVRAVKEIRDLNLIKDLFNNYKKK